MNKFNIDGLLGLAPEEIKIVFLRLRGETVEETATHLNMSPATVYSRITGICKMLDLKNWKEIEAELRVPLMRIIPNVRALEEGWPEAFREKIEALREPNEPPEEPQASKEPPNVIGDSSNPVTSEDIPKKPNQTPQRPRIPWPVIAIPLLILGLGCIAVLVFGGSFLATVFRRTPAPTTVSETPAPQIENTSTPQPAFTPTVQMTDTAILLPTDTLTLTLTFTPTTTLTPIPTDTKSPIGLVKGDELSDNRVTLKFQEIKFEQGRTRTGQRPPAPIVFVFDFTNHSGDTILLQIGQDKFRAEDNLGNELTCEFWNGVTEAVETIQQPLENGKTFDLGVFCGEGKIPPGVTTYTLYVTNFSSLPDSTWIAKVIR